MQHQLLLCPFCSKKLLPPTLFYLPDIGQRPRAFEVVPGVRAIARGFPCIRVRGDAVEPYLVAPVNSNSIKY